MGDVGSKHHAPRAIVSMCSTPMTWSALVQHMRRGQWTPLNELYASFSSTDPWTRRIRIRTRPAQRARASSATYGTFYRDGRPAAISNGLEDGGTSSPSAKQGGRKPVVPLDTGAMQHYRSALSQVD